MSHGVYFALLSMIFAGIYDVVCKRYSARERSRGMYVLGIGLTWAVMQLLWMLIIGVPFHTESTTISFGLIAGILLTASNLLLVEGLTHIDVSLGSTVYRLNTIGVVLLSYLVLNESIGSFKLAGIVVGIIAILLMYGNGKSTRSHGKSLLFFWIVVCASLCRALYGIVSKAGLSAHADAQSMLLLVAVCWIVGGGCYAKGIEKRFIVTRKKIAYSLLSGFLVFCIVNFLIEGLKTGQASIIIPIANMSFVVALLLSAALKTERLTVRSATAAGLAVVSILLLFNA